MTTAALTIANSFQLPNITRSLLPSLCMCFSLYSAHSHQSAWLTPILHSRLGLNITSPTLIAQNGLGAPLK